MRNDLTDPILRIQSILDQLKITERYLGVSNVTNPLTEQEIIKVKRFYYLFDHGIQKSALNFVGEEGLAQPLNEYVEKCLKAPLFNATLFLSILVIRLIKSNESLQKFGFDNIETITIPEFIYFINQIKDELDEKSNAVGQQYKNSLMFLKDILFEFKQLILPYLEARKILAYAEGNMPGTFLPQEYDLKDTLGHCFKTISKKLEQLKTNPEALEKVRNALESENKKPENLGDPQMKQENEVLNGIAEKMETSENKLEENSNSETSVQAPVSKNPELNVLNTNIKTLQKNIPNYSVQQILDNFNKWELIQASLQKFKYSNDDVAKEAVKNFSSCSREFALKSFDFLKSKLDASFENWRKLFAFIHDDLSVLTDEQFYKELIEIFFKISRENEQIGWFLQQLISEKLKEINDSLRKNKSSAELSQKFLNQISWISNNKIPVNEVIASHIVDFLEINQLALTGNQLREIVLISEKQLRGKTSWIQARKKYPLSEVSDEILKDVLEKLELAKKPNQHTINLSRCNLKAKDLAFIMEEIKTTTAKKLDLSHNLIDSLSPKIVKDLLEHPTIAELDLSGNDGRDSINLFPPGSKPEINLPNNKKFNLILDYCTHVTNFFDSFMHSPISAISLQLSFKARNNNDLEAFRKFLESCENLKRIDLRYNYFANGQAFIDLNMIILRIATRFPEDKAAIVKLDDSIISMLEEVGSSFRSFINNKDIILIFTGVIYDEKRNKARFRKEQIEEIKASNRKIYGICLETFEIYRGASSLNPIEQIEFYEFYMWALEAAKSNGDEANLLKLLKSAKKDLGENYEKFRQTFVNVVVNREMANFLLRFDNEDNYQFLNDAGQYLNKYETFLTANEKKALGNSLGSKFIQKLDSQLAYKDYVGKIYSFYSSISKYLSPILKFTLLKLIIKKTLQEETLPKIPQTKPGEGLASENKEIVNNKSLEDSIRSRTKTFISTMSLDALLDFDPQRIFDLMKTWLLGDKEPDQKQKQIVYQVLIEKTSASLEHFIKNNDTRSLLASATKFFSKDPDVIYSPFNMLGTVKDELKKILGSDFENTNTKVDTNADTNTNANINTNNNSASGSGASVRFNHPRF